MSTPVVMPQMGESIAEGTIVRWIKKVGESVDRDEPLFEISTDKVDAEIPSPAAGTLLEISVKEGETVPVNSVVAMIGVKSAAAAPAGAAPAQPAERADQPSQPAAASTPSTAASNSPAAVNAQGSTSTAARAGVAVEEREAAAMPPPSGKSALPEFQGDGSPAQSPSDGGTGQTSAASASTEVAAPSATSPDDLRRQKSSPLVRRIAKEHGVDITRITGSGAGGRVTKHDILEFIDKVPVPAPAETSEGVADEMKPVARSVPSASETRPPGPTDTHALEDRVEPMSIMRKKISEHMVLSRRTSAHVYSVFEVNYSQVDKVRKAKRDEYEHAGVKLTFTSFIAKVAIDCLRRHPVINASLDGENIVYKRDVNLGIAVALENGLIVPVVKRADEKNLLGLSRAIADVADRARRKKLNPDEVQGGTFTITNPGGVGAQFGLPIINQPQVAILGVGAIEKRPVVIDDMIGIRLMGHLTLGYDHRLIDGAVADQFMSEIKKGLEAFDVTQI